MSCPLKCNCLPRIAGVHNLWKLYLYFPISSIINWAKRLHQFHKNFQHFQTEIICWQTELPPLIWKPHPYCKLWVKLWVIIITWYHCATACNTIRQQCVMTSYSSVLYNGLTYCMHCDQRSFKHGNIIVNACPTHNGGCGSKRWKYLKYSIFF